MGQNIYLLHNFQPPWQKGFSFDATALFCEIFLSNEMEKAGAKETDFYPNRVFSCTDDEYDNLLQIQTGHNDVALLLTFHGLCSVLVEMTLVIRAFGDRLPAFEFEVHVQDGMLRPCVAIGRFEPTNGMFNLN